MLKSSAPKMMSKITAPCRSFQNKDCWTPTAIITGGRGRIGRAIADYLKVHGWNVLVHSSTEGAILADFNSSEQVALMLSKLPTPDLLINNAAIFEPDDTQAPNVLKASLKNEEHERHMQINYLTPVQMTEYFAIRATKPLCVINMLDAWASATESCNFKHYQTSKAKLLQFTKDSIIHFSSEAGFSHVRVNGIELGATLYKAGQSAKKFAELQRKFPTSIDDILQIVNYIVMNKNLRGEVINIPEWKSAH